MPGTADLVGGLVTSQVRLAALAAMTLEVPVKATLMAVAAISTAALLAACGSATNSPGSGSSTPKSSSSQAATAGKFLGCMVTDTGGIDDRSFNASSWQGMQEAATADPSIKVKYLSSTSASDYTPNINAFIQQKCGIIVTVGFLMGDNTQTAAKANPSQKFAIVDYNYSPVISNVDSLVFNTVQDGFLGGYLAAAESKTHKVATFGGQKLPTVTIYMDGFYDGVQYYNQQNHANVQVLGWNEKTQNGSFTGDFTDQGKGQTLTQTFISSGADVIFPVAGNVGLGAAKAVQNADTAAGSTKVKMLWVDTDGCTSAAQYCKYFLSSVTKGIQASVKAAVLAAAQGTFKGGDYIGTLANGGAVLSPFHDFSSQVSAAVQAKLKTIEAGIESGSIQTPTKSPAT
jgi:basic membrane protein A and related proteins